MLTRLAELGMKLSEEIVERAASAPYHPETRHEPGRAFAAASRSVRLTLTLQGRLDRTIIALCNGKFAAEAPARVVGLASEDASRSARHKARDVVRVAIERESGDVETADVARGRLQERLIEGDAYDALLTGPLRATVAAICADLGLAPDWSDWSDDAGFPPKEERRADRLSHREREGPSEAGKVRGYGAAEPDADLEAAYPLTLPPQDGGPLPLPVGEVFRARAPPTG